MNFFNLFILAVSQVLAICMGIKMVKYTSKGIRVGTMEIPLYSATFHYWRSKTCHWEQILKQIRGMYFEIVETYIPWSVHEETEGCFDFGSKQPNKNLDEFLSLCEKCGLYAIVRPGPHINAEMTNFGYPEWILYDEEIQAKNPWGTTVIYPYVTKQFPIPSYASDKLYEKTERYFKELEPILKKHTYPNGCIIAVQADNETCNFFRDKPYIMDYSNQSVAGYRKFLQKKYRTAETLSKEYKICYNDFSVVMPPEGYLNGELTRCLDWVEFKEEQILDTLTRMVGILKRLALPVPIFHNCAYQTYTPISVQRDEKIEGLDVAGIDAYPEPGDTTMLKERIRYMAGSSRLPYIPEFGSGSWFDRLTLLSPSEEEFAYLYAFMYGLKAIGYYMTVERDRWSGCPVRNNGSIRKEYYTLFQKLNQMAQTEAIFQYTRKPRILVLRNYDMGRIKAAMEDISLNTLSSNCFIAGPDIPPNLFLSENDTKLPLDTKEAYYEEAYVKEVCKKLDEFKLDYNISDCYLDWEQMCQYDLMIASVYGQENRKYQELLKQFQKLPCKKLITGGTEAAKSVIAWKSESFAEWTDKECILLNPHIEYTIHWSPDGKNYLLYLANTDSEKQPVTVTFCDNRIFISVINGNDLEGKGKHLCFSLKGKTVSIFKIQKDLKEQKGEPL